MQIKVYNLLVPKSNIFSCPFPESAGKKQNVTTSATTQIL